MTLGEFRALTAGLPDGVLIAHNYWTETHDVAVSVEDVKLVRDKDDMFSFDTDETFPFLEIT